MQRAGSRIWRTACIKGATRDPLLPTSPRLLTVIYDVLSIALPTDSSARLDRWLHTTAQKRRALRRPRYVMLELRREYWRCTSILNRARANARWMFEFLSLFTLRRSPYCTLLSIVREFPPWTIMHFSGMKNRRGVSRSSNNSVFIKFQRRTESHMSAKARVARWIKLSVCELKMIESLLNYEGGRVYITYRYEKIPANSSDRSLSQVSQLSKVEKSQKHFNDRF